MGFAQFMVSYGITILSVIATVLSLILAYLKAKKTGNAKGVVSILEKIPSLVTTAESLFGDKKGSAKLDYVLTQIRLYALQNNIKVDVNDLTAQINSVVETTNNVNVSKIKVDEQTPSEVLDNGSIIETDVSTNQNTINL